LPEQGIVLLIPQRSTGTLVGHHTQHKIEQSNQSNKGENTEYQQDGSESGNENNGLIIQDRISLHLLTEEDKWRL